MGKIILTGYNLIDKELGGLKPGEITLVGGRPAMGKTSLALNIALNVARSRKKVLFFSAEDNFLELELRAAAIISDVSLYRLNELELTETEWERLKKGMKEIKELPIRFINWGALDAIKFWSEYGDPSMDLIIYDYLQLIHNKYTQLKEGTPELTPVKYLRRLKKIAKKNNVPMMVLTQVSRKLEKRKNKRPKIKDIRVENISDDAYDQAVLIYRDAFYDKKASRAKAELIGKSNKKHINVSCDVIWNDKKLIFEDCSMANNSHGYCVNSCDF